MPSLEHQRTTTYTLTASDPMLIDATTTYSIPWIVGTKIDPAAAVTGIPLLAAHDEETRRQQSDPLSRNQVSFQPSSFLRPLHLASEVLTLKTQGLIRIDGDRMTYIVSNPGGPRPASFDTALDDGLTKVTLRRIR